LPREKPAPKDKQKTKWEKFREERGLPPRKSRSRLVFDELTNDWVPRWGAGSIKKIQEKHNWLMPTKPKHETAGITPFEWEKLEKKGKNQKQDLAELKNKIYAARPSTMRQNVQILDKKKDGGNDNATEASNSKMSSKLRTD
jgi:regulator of ribosome biosynthesis